MSGRRRSSRTRSGQERLVERCSAGRGAVDVESFTLEPSHERLGDGVLILDDQDAHASSLAHESPNGIGYLPNLCCVLPELWRELCPPLTAVLLPSNHRLGGLT